MEKNSNGMKLLIITQKVDKDDSNLGFFHEWINGLSKNFESIKVICLYKGKSELPKNVEIFSLGKESDVSSIGILINLFKHVYSTRNSYDKVFVHMNPIYLVLLGWYFKLKKIPVYLWYVHRSVDLKLRIAVLFADKIFTSAKESFRIKTDKVVFLGHGINVDILPNIPHIYTGNTLKIVHIGRITKIKHIETVIDAMYELKKIKIISELTLFGQCETGPDKKYKQELDALISKNGLIESVIFAGGILHDDLSKRLRNSHIAVNMTPSGGMDKAVLEAICLGVPAFSANTAFTSVFDEYNDLFMYKYLDSKDLASKITNFISLSNGQQIIGNLSTIVRKDFSLENLIDKMVAIMK